MELYGHLLSHSKDLHLAEQVQDILRAEIYAGRWAIGERLPSIADLAKQTGLSIDPIQRALKGLKEEGYLTLEARKGAFLKATVPVGAAPLGTIGILIEDDAEETLLGATIRTEAFGRWRLQTLLSVLQQCNWDARVVTLKKEETPAEVNGPNGPFGEGVKGIIAMHHFPHLQTFELKPGQTPIVFLGTHDNNCLPTVTAAASDGLYRMTRRVIEAGHRDIVVCCNPRNSRAQTADLLEGHKRAMHESNLAVNADAIECSLATDHDQLSNLQDYIQRFSDATAIISVSGQTAYRLMEVAGLMGIGVPQQLSIASLGHGPNIPGRKLTGLIYDWETIAKASLDVLIEQSKTRKCLLARVEYRPRLFPGETLSQPHHLKGGK